MRDRLSEIRTSGASLVLIGNGTPEFARAFREDLSLDEDIVLLVDPALRSYRAAGMRRGFGDVLLVPEERADLDAGALEKVRPLLPLLDPALEAP